MWAQLRGLGRLVRHGWDRAGWGWPGVTGIALVLLAWWVLEQGRDPLRVGVGALALGVGLALVRWDSSFVCDGCELEIEKLEAEVADLEEALEQADLEIRHVQAMPVFRPPFLHPSAERQRD